MKLFLIPVLLILICVFTQAQTKVDADIDTAYQNAKKGIYWALQNLPVQKQKLENDLIAGDKLYASVKAEREVNGFKIEACGYWMTNQVTIKIYKSNDVLVKEGYLKKSYLEEFQ